ncbi:MAG: glycosyltransferase family 1 protein [Opitutaceae bacterium]|nr:glycosyltransferase family 1 protein [Opitutaceae bacterium]
MIYFDVTKFSGSGHRSGLMRVSARLGAGLAGVATSVRWPAWNRAVRPDDWFLTSELFSEEERPGFSEFVRARPCRLAAIFHDAIPLQHPHFTWPQSVARHPGYMKLLAGFDRVWAVSEASRRDLTGFWRWQGAEKTPPVEVLTLGADFNGQPRVVSHLPPPATRLLCVGILEPRKNQLFLLEVCAELWGEGRPFELHVVGRLNPHFGAPIAAQLRLLRKTFPGLHYHAAASDAEVTRLYATARASVFPTMAEGCGLPLLESLWMGVPCVHSDLPVLRGNAEGGGCLPVAPGDRAAWKAALHGLLTDDTLHARLRLDTLTRPLPTWAEAAQTLRAALR